MIVDDETDIEPLFKQRFRREIRDGILECHFCFSAECALEYLNSARATDIVLILSDINMPGMNGLELLRILKEKYSHLTVFMVTAYDDEEKYKKALEYGADRYLTKPIDFEKLKAEVLDFSQKTRSDNA
jgi:DNA-binding response OmpR family regulator